MAWLGLERKIKYAGFTPELNSRMSVLLLSKFGWDVGEYFSCIIQAIYNNNNVLIMSFWGVFVCFFPLPSSPPPPERCGRI